MADIREDILDAIAIELGGITGINECTRQLLPPETAKRKNGYIGISPGIEEKLAEDSTHVKYGLNIDLVVVIKGHSIETILKRVKDKVYGTFATDIGAKIAKIVGVEPIDLNDAQYTSANIMLDLVYVAAKSAF